MSQDTGTAVPTTIPAQFDRTPPPISDPALAYVHAATTHQFHLLQTQLDEMRETAKSAADLRAAEAEPSELDKKVAAAVKRGSMWRQAIGLLVFLVTGAVGSFVALKGYAADFVEDEASAAHTRTDDPVEPSVQRVRALENGLNATKSGVRAVVQGQQHNDVIRDLEMDLKTYQQDYDDRVTEWAARKARIGDRAGEKPKKNNDHIQLENKLRRQTKQGGVDYASVLRDLDNTN